MSSHHASQDARSVYSEQKSAADKGIIDEARNSIRSAEHVSQSEVDAQLNENLFHRRSEMTLQQRLNETEFENACYQGKPPMTMLDGLRQQFDQASSQ